MKKEDARYQALVQLLDRRKQVIRLHKKPHMLFSFDLSYWCNSLVSMPIICADRRWMQLLYYFAVR
jgi:hypothetical protein